MKQYIIKCDGAEILPEILCGLTEKRGVKSTGEIKFSENNVL